ncbi:MAG: hypothetical protein ACC707_20035 [Thiohalomonadales bacterium]
MIGILNPRLILRFAECSIANGWALTKDSEEELQKILSGESNKEPEMA